MKSVKLLNWALLMLLALAFPAAAQQDFKYLKKLETPYVPTNQPTVDAMLRIANVGPGDVVIDLGSGDGRILITAAKYRGARGFGVDLDQELVTESLDHAKAAGVSDRVHFYRRDLFETRISEATVVTMYLLPHVNLQLRPRLFAELKPGTRVVSHDYHMGEWKADIEATVRGRGSRIYFWVMPAQVGGAWNLQIGRPGAQPYDVQFQQQFQEIDGSAIRAGKPSYVRDARLDGERIFFSADRRQGLRPRATLRGARERQCYRRYGARRRHGAAHPIHMARHQENIMTIFTAPRDDADLPVAYRDIAAAPQTLAGVAHRTPVLTSNTVDERTGAKVFFKCENMQRGGAFKFRGAYNALSNLMPEQKQRGVVAYSSGNHAQAVALAGRLLGIKAVIVMPDDAPVVKVQATRGYGATKWCLRPANGFARGAGRRTRAQPRPP